MIDLHCHLDLYPQPVDVVDECARRNMYVLSVTTTPSAWRGTSALADGKARIRTALGLHPQLAGQRKSELAQFDEFIHETRFVGEIGLDGSPECRLFWDEQILVFEHVLQSCARAGGRILTIHSRRAEKDVLVLLERHRIAGPPILHWFSGSLRNLEHAVRLDCWYSVGPAMLRSQKGRALVGRMPPDRVLTETDGPFAMVAGRAILPWDVNDAVTRLAAIWSVDTRDAEARLTSNFRRLLETQQGHL